MESLLSTLEHRDFRQLLWITGNVIMITENVVMKNTIIVKDFSALNTLDGPLQLVRSCSMHCLDRCIVTFSVDKHFLRLLLAALAATI